MKKEDAKKEEPVTVAPVKASAKPNVWKITALVMTMLFIVSILTGGFTAFAVSGAGSLTGEQAAKKAVDYLNENLLQGRATAKTLSVKEANGMYSVKLDISGMEYDSYITKDGSLLFPTSVDLNAPVEQQPQETKKTCEDIAKSETPKLQAFVVSRCPYGLQMQRTLTSVAKILGDNIEIRYLGAIESGKITSMHGEQEAEENLRQICIREEQNNKYWGYVSCFIKEGKTDGCLDEAKIDKTKLASCTTDPKKGIKYAEEDFALHDQYGASGSPTLVLNGEVVSEFDFGGRTPDAVKTLLCCAFSTQPEACSAELSTAQASTGFSTEETGTTGTGSCG